MQHHEDKDPAWDLLKSARPVKVSSAFAQDVLREVRKLDSTPAGAGSVWFSARWGVAFASAAALLIVGVFVFNRPADPAPGEAVSPAPIAATSTYKEEITLEEFAAELDELAYLSELMDVSDTTLLPDEDLAALLF